MGAWSYCGNVQRSRKPSHSDPNRSWPEHAGATEAALGGAGGPGVDSGLGVVGRVGEVVSRILREPVRSKRVRRSINAPGRPSRMALRVTCLRGVLPGRRAPGGAWPGFLYLNQPFFMKKLTTFTGAGLLLALVLVPGALGQRLLMPDNLTQTSSADTVWAIGNSLDPAGQCANLDTPCSWATALGSGGGATLGTRRIVYLGVDGAGATVQVGAVTIAGTIQILGYDRFASGAALTNVVPITLEFTGRVTLSGSAGIVNDTRTTVDFQNGITFVTGTNGFGAGLKQTYDATAVTADPPHPMWDAGSIMVSGGILSADAVAVVATHADPLMITGAVSTGDPDGAGTLVAPNLSAYTLNVAGSGALTLAGGTSLRMDVLGGSGNAATRQPSKVTVAGSVTGPGSLVFNATNYNASTPDADGVGQPDPADCLKVDNGATKGTLGANIAVSTDDAGTEVYACVDLTTVGGSFTVGADVNTTFANAVTIGGGVAANDNVTFTKAATITGAVSVAEAASAMFNDTATIGGSLSNTSSGLTIFAKGAEITGSLTLTGDAGVTAIDPDPAVGATDPADIDNPGCHPPGEGASDGATDATLPGVHFKGSSMIGGNLVLNGAGTDHATDGTSCNNRVWFRNVASNAMSTVMGDINVIGSTDNLGGSLHLGSGLDARGNRVAHSLKLMGDVLVSGTGAAGSLDVEMVHPATLSSITQCGSYAALSAGNSIMLGGTEQRIHLNNQALDISAAQVSAGSAVAVSSSGTGMLNVNDLSVMGSVSGMVTVGTAGSANGNLAVAPGGMAAPGASSSYAGIAIGSMEMGPLVSSAANLTIDVGDGMMLDLPANTTASTSLSLCSGTVGGGPVSASMAVNVSNGWVAAENTINPGYHLTYAAGEPRMAGMVWTNAGTRTVGGGASVMLEADGADPTTLNVNGGGSLGLTAEDEMFMANDINVGGMLMLNGVSTTANNVTVMSGGKVHASGGEVMVKQTTTVHPSAPELAPGMLDLGGGMLKLAGEGDGTQMVDVMGNGQIVGGTIMAMAKNTKVMAGHGAVIAHLMDSNAHEESTLMVDGAAAQTAMGPDNMGSSGNGDTLPDGSDVSGLTDGDPGFNGWTRVDADGDGNQDTNTDGDVLWVQLGTGSPATCTPVNNNITLHGLDVMTGTASFGYNIGHTTIAGNAMVTGGELTFAKHLTVTGNYTQAAMDDMGMYMPSTATVGVGNVGFDCGNGAPALPAVMANTTVHGDFMVGAPAGAGNHFDQNGGTLTVNGDFDHMGSGGLLDGPIDFRGSGEMPQYVMVGNGVMLSDTHVEGTGLMLMSDVAQGGANTLNLTRGAISSMMDAEGNPYTWTLGNQGHEMNLVGRNSADPAMGSVVMRGSRVSYVSASFKRTMWQGTSGSGSADGGYLFPTGSMDDDGRHHYRPVMMQLPTDVGQRMSTSVTAMDNGGMYMLPAEGLVAPVDGGTAINLDVTGSMMWKVMLDGTPEAFVTLRVAVEGLGNIFDVAGLRLVQFDCDGSNARVPGIYNASTSADGVFAASDFIAGVPNITHDGVDLGMCSVFAIGANGVENPIHLDDTSAGLAQIQFIHNVTGAPAVDVYSGDLRLASSLGYQSGTGFARIGAGDQIIRVVPEGAPHLEAQVPISLGADEMYTLIVHGTPLAQGINLVSSRATSVVANKADVAFAHGAPNLGSVNLRRLDGTPAQNALELLAYGLSYGEVTPYGSLDPEFYSIELASGGDQIDVFLSNFGGYADQGLIMNLSGAGNSSATGLSMFGVTGSGAVFMPAVVTSTDPGAEIPTEFALLGNYPNPFNPSTRIQFDLPESAEVSVQVIDMLGRHVMTVPSKELEAGAKRSIEINASSLASGNYLYRVIATGATNRHVETGRMVLVK